MARSHGRKLRMTRCGPRPSAFPDVGYPTTSHAAKRISESARVGADHPVFTRPYHKRPLAKPAGKNHRSATASGTRFSSRGKNQLDEKVRLQKFLDPNISDAWHPRVRSALR